MVTYTHTQQGRVVLMVLGIYLCLLALVMVAYQSLSELWVVALILLICLLLFSSLTITVDRTRVRLAFGLGIIHKTFLVKDIVSCRVVINPWYYGWGIRLTPYGWLFNVSGLHAVEIRMKKGKTYRLGTDEPEELKQAIMTVKRKYY